ncbi:MAG: trigger factor [Gammaproteobacteria bacterium RBG_16_51_14]|nr:MAG: trigger factor [Gammaproteobacteria bacterium RBG_16_51_14]
MQVSVENTGALERKMRVEVPEDRISTEVMNRLQSMTRTTRVQGFRPGKVPLKVVKNRFGTRVREEVIGEVVRSSFYEAITQEKLRPAGPPQIIHVDDGNGEDLVYTATFEIYPEIMLSPVEKLELERPSCEITDAAVDKMIQVLRKQRRDLNPVLRAAAMGDVLVIDFTGTADGAAFEGGTAENYEIELGSKRFLIGFEEGLVGSEAGAEVTLKLKFPDDYRNEALKGKPVEFQVHVREVRETVLPELNDALFASLGVNTGGLAAFREEIKRNLEREAEMAIRKQMKDMVMKALHESNSIELPQSMVDREVRQVQQQLIENLQQQGLAYDAIESAEPSLFKQEAQRRVALQLIFAEIVRQNEIRVDKARVREMIEKAASGYENPSAVVNWYYSDQKNLAEVEALALEDDIVDWVLGHAQVTEKTYTFDELMNKRQTEAV